MIIRVHVQTGARQDKIEELGVEEFKVWTTAIPEKDQANDAVIDILAEHFNASPSKIRIRSGNKSKHKLIEIE